MTYHIPVLLPQVLEGLQIQPNQWYIDATVGGGGYTVELLKRGARVLGIDTDPEAIAYTKQRLRDEVPTATEGSEWKLVQDNFRNIEEITRKEGLAVVAGVLFDLGVSSHQLDTGGRGMSFRFPDQPFDLRLNQTEGESAWELLKRLSKEDLYEIIAQYGEEERASRIANGIYSTRHVKPIRTVGDMIDVVKNCVPAAEKDGALARVFQAFRIAVNDELGALKAGLVGSEHILVKDGRLVVISFHSLEDRIVKQYMRNNTWTVVTEKIQRADEEEIHKNRRSRSAKLRIAVKQ